MAHGTCPAPPSRHDRRVLVKLSGVELELVRVRLHDRSGDDLGVAELPAGWTLGPGDLLVDGDGRVVQVVELVPFPPPSRIAALAKVTPGPRLTA
jgi:urease accessory protein UreE